MLKQKKWMAIGTSVLLVALVIAGVLALAAEYGTQNDPLVSLSYINSVFAPEMQKDIDAKVDAQVNALAKSIDAKLADFTANNAPLASNEATLDSIAASLAGKLSNQETGSASFALVKVPAGKTVSCKVGTEILLRLGNASCISSGTPGLIDTTTGGELAGGGALARNHLYLCTVDGRGVKASADTTLLVRGAYTMN